MNLKIYRSIILLKILGVHVLSILGQNNLHSHGTIRHSHTDTTFHTHPNMPPGTGSRPVPGRPHLHRHGTIIHSHHPGTIHNHHNLPEGSKPVPNEPLLEAPGSVKAIGADPHGHGSVTHSHTSQSSLHSHPDPSQVPGPVVAGLDPHGQGSGTHSHTGQPLPHSHPDPSQASGPAAGSPDVHSHGSVTHSHSSISSHSHQPPGPGASDVMSLNTGGAQHGTNPNHHSHGSLTHSHSGTSLHHHPNLPSNSNRVPGRRGFHRQVPSTISHTGSQPGLPRGLIPVRQITNQRRTGDHLTPNGSRIPPRTDIGGATISSTPDANRPRNRLAFNRDAAPPQVNRFRGTLTSDSVRMPPQTNRGAPVAPPASATNIFMQLPPYLRNIFKNPPTPNIVRTPSQGNRLRSPIPVNGARMQTNMANQGRPSQTFRDPQPPPSPQRRQRVPNYSLAGGASCNSQCHSGRAARSCFCARYLCLYQGCSANCTLLREGEFIRASCKQFVGGPYHMPKTTSNALPRCAQTLDPGSCSSRIYARYGYDTKRQACVRFFYSGCGGNQNRFTTRNSCNAACP
ncbi:protein pygopus [Patella vulgata]|uniref:protein pygopus n=1 Tax=Patella vulgata TaxID=6465 RepID=UPI00217FCAA5|nr:protein pygopus [Patella vulgata]